eukprot:361632-Chlamydomonas_euryale.AAC.2
MTSTCPPGWRRARRCAGHTCALVRPVLRPSTPAGWRLCNEGATARQKGHAPVWKRARASAKAPTTSRCRRRRLRRGNATARRARRARFAPPVLSFAGCGAAAGSASGLSAEGQARELRDEIGERVKPPRPRRSPAPRAPALRRLPPPRAATILAAAGLSRSSDGKHAGWAAAAAALQPASCGMAAAPPVSGAHGV